MSKAAWLTLGASFVFTTTVIKLVYKDQEDQRNVTLPSAALM